MVTRRMTWIIIANESRKPSEKIENVQKGKKKETCYLNLFKTQ